MERQFAKLFESLVYGQILITSEAVPQLDGTQTPVLMVRWVHDGVQCVGIVEFDPDTHGVLQRNKAFANFSQQQAVEYILNEIAIANNTGVENGTTRSS